MGEANGLVDASRMDETARRPWNGVAFGQGRVVQGWKAFPPCRATSLEPRQAALAARTAASTPPTRPVP